ncbi:unnamed protein product, partial [Prorocentrum cordatum]
AGSRGTHPANATQQGGGVVDVWYCDDGTIYLLPELAALYLQAYDSVTATQGGKRNFSKTVVTLYATEEQVLENAPRWDLERLKTLSPLQAPTAPGKSLGVALGGAQARVADFRTKASIAQKMHDKVRRIGGSGAELALSQACFGVAKVTHLLRACGDELVEEADALRSFDRLQKGTLDRLVPGCDAESRAQASLSLRVGGLGMRRARDVALPAVVASRAMAREKVQQLDAELAKAGLLRAGQLLAEHAAAARRAVGMLRAEPDGVEAAEVEGLVAEAAHAAAAAWARRMEGKGGEAAAPRAQWTAFAEDERVAPAGGAEEPLGGGAAAGGGPFGSGDDGVDALPERPGARGVSRLTATGVQRQLSILVGNSRLRRLVEGLEAAGRFSDMRRLQELRDPSVDHSWVRRLDFCEGPVLREDDYPLCLQLRLEP